MSDVNQEWQAAAWITKQIREAVLAERERCIHNMCDHCNGKNSHIDSTAKRQPNGTWYHGNLIEDNDHICIPWCDAYEIHERVYQEKLKEAKS